MKAVLSCGCFIVLSAVAAYAAPGLVASWTFDSASGSTFYDVTKHGYNANAIGSGVTTATGVKGQALSCPGAAFDIPVINSADSFNVLKKFSIEGWFNSKVNPVGTSQAIFSDEYMNSGSNGYACYINSSGLIDFSMSNGSGGWLDARSTSTVQQNTWYHVVCTYDSANLKLYINGVLNATVPFAGTYTLPHNNARIGCLARPNGTIDYLFNGLIDELKLYNFALSADSVAAHYSAIVPAPTLSSPSNGATFQPTALNLGWLGVTGASSYGVQVSTTSTFSSLVLTQNSIVALSQLVSGLSQGAVFYWRANTVSPAGKSFWSAVWSFSTVPPVPAAPILSTPASGSQNQPLSCAVSWLPAVWATSYGLQASVSSGFETYAYNQSGLTGTTGTITGLATSTGYYWRVNATDFSGSSPWSLVWSFSTVPPLPAVPTLVTPASGAINLPIAVTLGWNTADRAASYTLQVATTSSFSSTVFAASGLTGTSKAVAPLAYEKSFFWRVNATNPGGTSNWCSSWSFSTVIDSTTIPHLIAMKPDTQNQSPVFRWYKSTNATAYQIQIDTIGNFYNPIVAQVSDTIYSRAIPLPGGRIIWRIGAVLPSVTRFSTPDTFWVKPTGVALSGAAARVTGIGSVRQLRHGLSIRYSVAKSCPVALDIFSLAGARVASLLGGSAEPGDHVLNWNGTDRLGKPLPAAGYLVRFTLSDRAVTQKVVLYR